MQRNTFFQIIKQILFIILNQLPCFGIKVSMAKIKMVIHNDSLNSTIKKNQIVLNYLKKKFKKLIKKYKSYEITENIRDKNSYGQIWVFWWQGLTQMPEIIKACYYNTLQMAGNRKVVLLDKNSIKEYIEFPDYVWNQLDKGTLRIQHFADMLRVRLLRQYGGLWLDASIYCLEPISAEIFMQDFYSLKSNPDYRFISEGRWTTFLIGGRKSFILFDFLDDFFLEYCKTGKPFVDYFMFDTAIALAYNELPEVRKAIDDLSVSEKGFYWLTEHLEDNYLDAADEMSTQSCFQKIAWSGCAKKDYSEQSVYYSIITKNECKKS